MIAIIEVILIFISWVLGTGLLSLVLVALMEGRLDKDLLKRLYDAHFRDHPKLAVSTISVSDAIHRTELESNRRLTNFIRAVGVAYNIPDSIVHIIAAPADHRIQHIKILRQRVGQQCPELMKRFWDPAIDLHALEHMTMVELGKLNGAQRMFILARALRKLKKTLCKQAKKEGIPVADSVECLAT